MPGKISKNEGLNYRMVFVLSFLILLTLAKAHTPSTVAGQDNTWRSVADMPWGRNGIAAVTFE